MFIWVRKDICDQNSFCAATTDNIQENASPKDVKYMNVVNTNSPLGDTRDISGSGVTEEEIKEGLSYTCICCHRLGTKVSVRQVPGKGDIDQQLEGLKLRLDGKVPGLFKACIHTPLKPCMKRKGKLWLCHTCYNALQKFKKPSLRYSNGLQADDIPDELKLSDLEAVLIAKRILFLKIFSLPTSRWRAVIDRVVNVPIEDEDLLNTLNKVKSLPRIPGEAGLVPVALKRKVEYKNKVIEAYIDPEKLHEAILKLKELGHPSYQDVPIDREFAQALRLHCQMMRLRNQTHQYLMRILMELMISCTL